MFKKVAVLLVLLWILCIIAGAEAVRPGGLVRRRVTKRQERSEFTSDAAWREALTEWLSGRCGVPGCLSVTVQADHIIPRAQGGLSDLYNGWLVCPAHHDAKTSGVLMIDPAWLRPEHHAYLAGHGWVEWSHIDPGFPGEWLPVGRGWRHFLGLPVTATRAPDEGDMTRETR